MVVQAARFKTGVADAACSRDRQGRSPLPRRSSPRQVPRPILGTHVSLASSTNAANGWQLAILLSAVFMTTAENSLVNVAVPSIDARLEASGGQLELVLSGYLLAYAVLLVTRCPPWEPVRLPARLRQWSRIVHARVARVRDCPQSAGADRFAHRGGGWRSDHSPAGPYGNPAQLRGHATDEGARSLPGRVRPGKLLPARRLAAPLIALKSGVATVRSDRL
jgi:hypothetical protein